MLQHAARASKEKELAQQAGLDPEGEQQSSRASSLRQQRAEGKAARADTQQASLSAAIVLQHSGSMRAGAALDVAQQATGAEARMQQSALSAAATAQQPP